MNLPGSRRNPFSIFRTRGLDEKDTGSLLDALPSPAVLVFLPESKLFAWNSKALALTAYTNAEFSSLTLQKLLPDYSRSTSSLSKESCEMELSCTSRSGLELPVIVNMQYLQPNSEWLLLQFEPSSVRSKRNQTKNMQAQQLNALQKLAYELLSSGNQIRTSRILEIMREITHSSQVAVYRANPQAPIMEYLSSVGETAWLPEKLQASEISRLPKNYLWQPGKRIRSAIHRLGRGAQLMYIGSSIIGDDKSISGILVTADAGVPPAEDLMESMEFAATLLSIAMQQEAVLGNLQADKVIHEEKLVYFTRVIENIAEGVVLLDLDRKIINGNFSFEEIFGYANDEIVGKPIEDVVIGAGNLLYALSTAINNVTTPSLGETTLHRREGQAFPAEVRVLPILHDETVKNILIIVRDKSEHQQIQFRAHQLEQRAFLGEVTAIFAHEVRNPINNISTALQLLGMNLKSDEKSMEVIERTKGDVDRLTQLIRSILTFSKSSEYKLEPLDFKLYLERLVMRWKPRFDRENVKVTWHVSPRTPHVRANEHALEQVFTNLLNNALRAMRGTGGTIVIKVAPGKSQSGTQSVQIDISDTGPGMPAEVLANIFNPFFTTDTQGTGLGLTITQRIILAHKGTITAESFLGEGTVFHINIPVNIDEDRSNSREEIPE